MNQFNSTSRSLNIPKTRHRCKCHYQVRWFYSKGAFLLLFNVTLASIACFTLLSILSSNIKERNFQKWRIVIPVCLFGHRCRREGLETEVDFNVLHIIMTSINIRASLNEG